MKTIKPLFVIFTVLFLGVSGYSMDFNANCEDTIRLKMNDNSEYKIYINGDVNTEELKGQIEDLVKNFHGIIENLSSDRIVSDTTVNLRIESTEDEIIIDDEYVIEEDDPEFEIMIGEDDIFWDYNTDSIEEDYVFDYDYEDDSYDWGWDYENYWDKNSNKKFKRIRNKFYFSFGFNNYLENGKFPNDDNSQYAVKPWGSWDVGFGGQLKWYVAKPFSLDFGYGFSWYNFKYQDKSTRVNKAEDEVEFTSLASYANWEGTDFIKSKTTVPYFNLSFIPTLDFSKFESSDNFKLRLGVGMYAGYRLGGKVKQVYEVDDTNCVYKKRGDYYLSSFRYGIKAIIGFGKNIEIYASYDLNTLYAEGKAPELNPISFGITWVF